MRTVNAYAATSATDPITKTTIERRDVGPKDVSIDIAYSGVCHSDIHTVRGEWGPIAYPQVVGHEIVGRVTEVGSEVSKHEVGDLVGVGCMVNSCKECEQCKAGQEQYCLKGNIQTYGGTDPADGTITQGGYSEASSSTRTSCSASPSPSTSRRSRRCSAPASPPTRRSATGTRAPARRSP